jgi:hypothetical protein
LHLIPKYLSRQVRLLVRKPHVLNDAATECDIKRSILDMIDTARVALEISNIVLDWQVSRVPGRFSIV